MCATHRYISASGILCVVHPTSCIQRTPLRQVLDAVVRVSESEGSLLPRPAEARRRWAQIVGDANRGRFQQQASRTAASSPGHGAAAVASAVASGHDARECVKAAGAARRGAARRARARAGYAER